MGLASAVQVHGSISWFKSSKVSGFVGLQANSIWLYIVPRGMRSLMNYIKQKYGNPPIIITENGQCWEELGVIPFLKFFLLKTQTMPILQLLLKLVFYFYFFFNLENTVL